MLYTVKCPKCGTKQIGLNLKETNGSFVCSDCKRHFIVEGDSIEEVKDEQSKDNRSENNT